MALKKQYINRGEKNWYIYCSKVILDMQKEENIDVVILHKLLIDHLLELLNYNETLELINFLYFIHCLHPSQLAISLQPIRPSL